MLGTKDKLFLPALFGTIAMAFARLVIAGPILGLHPLAHLLVYLLVFFACFPLAIRVRNWLAKQ